MKKVSVILNQKSKYIDRLFSYTAEDDIKVGSIVKVPFGKNNKIHTAVVVSISEDYDNNLKEIQEVCRNYVVPKEKIDLAFWIREKYICSYNEAISLFIPKLKDNLKKEYFASKNLSNEEIDELINKEKSNAVNKKYFLELLKQDKINISKLGKESGKDFLGIAKKFAELGILSLEQKEMFTLPDTSYKLERKNIRLNSVQTKVIENIKENIREGKVTLLHGVTGSGKTEVYIELIKDYIKKGKKAIMLVPEISLTPQTIARFKNVFGERIGIFHSKISNSERESQNSLILDNKLDIIIGARSAIFAPVNNLGLVIIDECHDEAYKSEQNPKYDTIELAEEICNMEKAGLVIATATPTIEQYFKATNNIYNLQTMDKRSVGNLPDVQIVDTFEHSIFNPDKILSESVIEEITKEILADKQVIIFLNKRGFSSTLTCNNCNDTIKCKNCDISLTYHKENNKMICHYCGYEEKYTEKCFSCGVGKYTHKNYGTQKVETELINAIEEARVLRLDKDTTSGKYSFEDLLTKFKNKEANILIGTQMISKGLDFDSVNIVVILNADQGLRFPDYRSKEKTYNMITQVSGRSGRSNEKGKVLILTNDYNNQFFDYVKEQNYLKFYNDEIKEREVFLYPPFSYLLKVQCFSENRVLAAETTKKIKDAITFYSKKRNKDFLGFGPVENLIKKIDSKYRWQIFYKVEDIESLNLLKKIISFILSEKRSIIVDKEVNVSIEINPNNLI